jgi:hypothetical protein
MRRLRFDSHLSDDDLLLFLDGEMGARKAAACRAHLEHCWHCQARVAAKQKIIQSFAQFVCEDYSRQLPPPPNQWLGFDRRLQQMQPPTIRRFRLQLPMLAGSGAAAAAIAALLLFVGRPEKLSATELLRRVMTAQASQPARSGETAPQPHPLSGQVTRVLESNHFDFRYAISGSAFAAWRNSLKDKEDAIAENGSLLTLSTKSRRTNGDDAQILEAALTVRGDNFLPVRETFTIKSGQAIQTVEFSQIEMNQPPPVPEIATLASFNPKAAAKPLPPSRAASPALELAVISRIHAIGADLGQEAAVTRGPGNVLAVSSVVEHVQRKQQILAALAPFQQDTSLRLNILTATEAEQQSQLPAERMNRTLVVDGTPSGKTIPSSDALFAYFRSQGTPDSELTINIQRFSDEVVRHSNAALLHSLALQDLVTRFSSREVQSFTEPERSQWRQMLNDHAEAIADNTAALRSQLAPVYGKAAGYGQASSPVAKPVSLLPASANLLSLVKAQDEIIHAAFTLSNENAKASSINESVFWRFLSEVQDGARQIQSLSTQ